MTLGRMWRSCRRWRLATLTDFWSVTQWLDEQRRRGRHVPALHRYLARTTEIAREGVERYRQCLGRLDAYTGGILSNPQTVQRLHLRWPEGTTLLAHFEQIGAELRERLARLSAAPVEQAVSEWRRQLDNPEDYRAFMTQLIHHFGNYEIIAMALPGTGPIVTDRRVQTVLGDMFAIKRRLIRLFELGYSVCRAWRYDPPRSSLGFFNPTTDLCRLVRGMLVEYMIQADPERVAAARRRAQQTGHAFVPYRFWRPAEALRQLAQVEYQPGPIRRPKPRRRYVDLQVGQVPPICTDVARLEWAIKELFNNAIAATSIVDVKEQGLVARPLRDGAEGNPRPAITLTVTPVRDRPGWRSRQAVRLVIADEGVGIDKTVLHLIPLWAFSTQRDWVCEEPERLITAPPVESRHLIIGGKGIGLAFARATILELGGELTIQSTLGVGTQVTIDLPVPTTCRP